MEERKESCYCDLDLQPLEWIPGCEPAITRLLELPEHTMDFILSLPTVRPSVERPALPRNIRKEKTLVLDLDQTLVHSSLQKMEGADFQIEINVPETGMKTHVFVKKRPFLLQFLELASSMFEIVVFTASPTVYAKRVLDLLDPDQKLIDHRMFRHHCHCHHHHDRTPDHHHNITTSSTNHKAHYIKDLSALGRDLSKVAIIDNSVEAFAFQLDNGVLIEDFLGSPTDTALVRMKSFLVDLDKTADARQAVCNYYNLLYSDT